MRAILFGPDRGILEALESQGVDVASVDGVPGAAALEAAGVVDADLFVLTDVEEATAIPVAKELNPDVRVVVYSPDTIPEFVRGLVDFAISTEVMEPDVVAEELAAGQPT